MHKLLRFSAIGSLAFLMLQLLAVAAPAQTPITSCGTVINAPGQYFLANDLNCQGGDAAITIESADVELDLDDHHITGPGADSRTGGIWVKDSVEGNVLLLGPGVIRNMVVCVRISSRGQAVFSRMTCLRNGNGFISDAQAIVTARANNASQNKYSGMIINGSDGEIGGNTANGNGYDGIIIGSGTRNHIDHSNIALSNGRRGISVQGSGNVIDSNTAQGNQEYDLMEGHPTCENLWENNTFNRANLSCIH